MIKRTVFYLNVTKINSRCQFYLEQSKAQKIYVDFDYPLSLNGSYEDWRRVYLDYYIHLPERKTINNLLREELTHVYLRGWKVINKNLRGKKVISGAGKTPVDRNKQLKDAEVQLLYEFQRWLLSPDLMIIRREIANAARNLLDENQWVEVFLTCTPIELARLPWETWEIGTDLGISEKIRIYRTPATIRHEPVRPLHRKARILAIIGYDNRLNFENDRQQIESLKGIAEVEFVGWNTGGRKVTNRESRKVFWVQKILERVKKRQVPTELQASPIDITELKTQIFHAIADERGWDVLFFAGHSNETMLTGGELGIAPNVSLAIQDIEEALKKAKERGLQFAIFNSCSGINIAESLINLGLSQVIVMREPIHNQVARKFLMQFLHSLTEYKDVHEAFLDACKYLKQQVTRFSYPSAYLIPSLFRHPDAELFRIEKFGFWNFSKRWFPTTKEMTLLGILLFLSLFPQVQDLLLEPRILIQSVYRYLTFQVPKEVHAPLLLVQIDNKSFKADKIIQRYPLDYSYLAKIVQQVSNLQGKFIGIDYVLDEINKQPPQNIKNLNQSIAEAVDKGAWFVFGSYQPDKDSSQETVSEKIASLNWSLEGNPTFFQWYVELPAYNMNRANNYDYPFGYLLALSYTLNHKTSPKPPQPKLQTQTAFKASFINYLIQYKIPQNRLLSITTSSEKFLQEWFHPIIDFSIPPDRAYNKISACELLKSCKSTKEVPNNLEQQIVIIAPGGYKEAGITGRGDDNYPIPLALAFWGRDWEDGKLPGGEAHAYMVHHLLTKRLVVPVPDFLMILLAALLAKGITLKLQDNPSNRKRLLKTVWVGVGIYVIISLQIYISAALLLPWFLPSVTLWYYIRLANSTAKRN